MPATPGVSAVDQVDESGPSGMVQLKASVCAGLSLKPETEMLSADSLVSFLTNHGATPRVIAERPDLVYLEVPVEDGKHVRLRLAILGSAAQAGEDLQRAMTQQGGGSWGVHRANLAVLAPAGHFDDIITFAAKTKLACWGVLTIEESDAIVVPGGYLEF